ncbi:MAG: sulfatase-like hydrolase/transferase [Planctomycetales bacterium]|nr:sulfatase-like hydrolase/transferase [Planctomycetales bacterium]
MRSLVAACCTLLFSLASPLGLAADQPNILWITAEDMSPTLGCYGDKYATTPHIDGFAAESVRYTHAFATAPVCSPSRSTLITGCYAPSLGTHNMRSAFSIPDSIRGFPAYLRDAGYYTTNNVKTDYNTSSAPRIIKQSWNESSATAGWWNRKQDQPFFCVFNLMTSHQSRTMVWPYKQFVRDVQSRLLPLEIHDPDDAPVPLYYPDTPIIRRTIARFYDCVTVMDKEVGDILARLEKDGLAEDTIVFFYSDHGSGMPRHKRCLYDSGMHVPLLIHFPEKYKHLAPTPPGETFNRMVSFVDFGPTVLSLADVQPPEHMQGQAFLGLHLGKQRFWAFGHRDRVDEAFDMSRSVRDKRYLYIRNYMPQYGWNQPSAWPGQGEIRHELSRFVGDRSQTKATLSFLVPRRPPEELYDCESDPDNLRNLAGSEDHADILESLRARLDTHLSKSGDLGFFPEIDIWRRFGARPPYTVTREQFPDWPDVLAREIPWRNPVYSDHGLGGAIVPADIDSLERRLKDDSPTVRIEAANVLARNGQIDVALPVLIAALEHENLTVVLYAARTIELLGDSARKAIPAMRAALERANAIRPEDVPATVVQSGDADLAMFIGFSTGSFLTKVAADGAGEDGWNSLFDGKSLTGWKASAEGDVKAVDGEIQILSRGKNLWLLHEQAWGDFELEVEAFMPAGKYNSGIGFRCQATGGKPKGYQCEVENAKSGMIYAIGSGWVWPKDKAETAKFHDMADGAFKPGQWNRFRIRCQGERIEIWVNDVKTADVRDTRFASGVVALQHHGQGGVHRFRNLRIREL